MTNSLLYLFLGGIGLPFPEDTPLILSGFLTSQGIIKPLPAFLVIYPGLLTAVIPPSRDLKDPAGMLEEFHSGYLLQQAARDEQPLKA